MSLDTTEVLPQVLPPQISRNFPTQELQSYHLAGFHS